MFEGAVICRPYRRILASYPGNPQQFVEGFVGDCGLKQGAMSSLMQGLKLLWVASESLYRVYKDIHRVYIGVLLGYWKSKWKLL